MTRRPTERNLALPHGVTLMTYSAGSGPPLLFLPGSNADFRLRGPVFQSALIDHFQVVTFEHRGLGRSSGPESPWTMTHFAQDALAVLDAYKTPRAAVIGESFGAMVAQVLLSIAPERIAQTALCGGSAGGKAGQSLAFERLMRLDAEERARVYLLHLNARNAELRDNAPDRFAEMVKTRCAFEEVFLGGLCQPNGYAKLLEARAQHDSAEALGMVRKDGVLILGGEEDRIAPPENQRALQACLPGSLLKMFPGGHDFLFATPEPVAWILAQWHG